MRPAGSDTPRNGALRQAWVELKYQQIAYWRNPLGAFFTFFMPVLFLVIFASIDRGGHYQGEPLNQYFIPGIMTFGVIAACYTNLAISLTSQREEGILKRVRGTPLPAWVFLAATVASSIVRAAVLVALTLGLGAALYGLEIPLHTAAALAAAVVLGAATFCALGVAITAFIPNADAAPAIVNAVYLPLMFLSGTFFPISSTSVLAKIASYFPVRPFVLLCTRAIDLRTSGSGFDLHQLGALALWGLVGVVVAVRRFSWVPRRAT